IALVSGLSAPVLTFVIYLALPILLNLFLTSLVIRWIYRQEFRLARKSFTQLIDLEATLKESRVSDLVLAKQTTATLH
ncbi:MAG: hypothetical protein ACK4TI_04745, partial [Nitrososphaerales archaeon]